MKTTHIVLSVIQKDLIKNSSATMVNIQAQIMSLNEIHYCEKEAPFCKVILNWQKDELCINRFGEVHTTVHCLRNQDSKIMIDSEWGNMEVANHTHKLEIEEKRILVAYDIMQDITVIESFEIEWKFGGGQE